MSTISTIPVADYLRLSEKPALEYREGEISQKSMPTTLHGLVQFLVTMLLTQRGLVAAPEIRVKLSESKYLVPDVIADHQLEQPYPSKPVLLCCEILSPEDRIGATFTKCEEYHAWGVPYCWVIDPVKQTAWQYHAGSDPAPAQEALHAGEVAITLVELFSGIRK